MESWCTSFRQETVRRDMVRGPTQEEYEKYTPLQKICYWVSVAIVFGILASLAIKKFFF